MQYIFMRVLLKRIKAIPSFLRDKTVPKRKKLLVIFGILYFTMPIDLIPAPILIFGFVDDLVICGSIIYYLKDELDRYWLNGKDLKPEEKYRGKKIINGVDYEIYDDEKQKEQ
ncbi:MAG: YkvA family protein [Anaerovoracaceae bacterium]|jgi:uncharacterized membrane protein YkvA (DUF1232 family)